MNYKLRRHIMSYVELPIRIFKDKMNMWTTIEIKIVIKYQIIPNRI